MNRRSSRLRRWAARERAWRLLSGERRRQGRVHWASHLVLDALAVLGTREREDERIRRIIAELGAPGTTS